MEETWLPKPWGSSNSRSRPEKGKGKERNEDSTGFYLQFWGKLSCVLKYNTGGAGEKRAIEETFGSMPTGIGVYRILFVHNIRGGVYLDIPSTLIF